MPHRLPPHGRSTPMPTDEPAVMAVARGKPRWLGVYLLLACLNLLALGASMELAARRSATYARSLRLEAAWSERSTRYRELGAVVAELDGPGKEVFAGRDMEGQSDRLRRAASDFDRLHAGARAELR